MRAERYRTRRHQRGHCRDASHSRDQSTNASFVSRDRSYMSNRKLKDSLLIHSKRTSSNSWTSASSYSDRQSFAERVSAREHPLWKYALNQRLYYIAGLLLNGALLSFYSVMAFADHEPCLTATGMNITRGFQFAFRLGFYATLADFINSAFLEFYLRQRHSADRAKLGFVTHATLAWQTVYAVMEWAFRAIFLLVSILQALIRTSTTGQYCIKELGVLELEGDWLYWLIVFQLFKIVVQSAWHIVLNRRSKAFFADQFEESTFVEQTTYLDQDDTRRDHRRRAYYDEEDPDCGEDTALMERSRSSEEDSDEPESRHHRVKFASSAKTQSTK